MFVLIYVCYYGERMLKPGKWPNEMEITNCENFICHDIASRKPPPKKQAFSFSPPGLSFAWMH